MSSKSRKKTPRTVTEARAPKTAPTEGGEHHGLEIPDELIHAPKETSKLRLALMVLLIVFLLVIFIVPGSFQQMFGGAGRQDAPALEWDRPGVGRQVMNISELQEEYRQLAQTQAFVQPFLVQLGITGDRVSREDTARIHVLNVLAEDAGVRVPEEHVGEYLTTWVDQYLQGDRDRYRELLAGMRADRIDPEAVVHRVLMAHRYLQLAGYGGAVATPEEIEASWTYDHTEVALDYVKVEVTEFEEAARSELPAADELESWLADQPEVVQEPLKTPERRTAVFVAFKNADDTPAAGLLEAYPPAEGVDPAEQAREYYDRVSFRRFPKPAPDRPEGEEVPESEAQVQEFLSFEEVEDVCLAEAPVHAALQAWLQDVRGRVTTGEEVDLAAQAEAYGLEAIALDDLTREALGEHASLGHPTLVNAVFSTSVDDFSFSVAWTEDVLGFSRTLSKTERSLPPFEEIQEEVADLWVQPRAAELAMEHLERIWEGFETFEPEPDERNPFAAFFAQGTHRRVSRDGFREAVEAAGLELLRRDFVDRGLRKDPYADEEEKNADHEFLWARGFLLHYLPVDEVAEPIADAEDAVFMVRVAEARPVSMDGMTPGDYQQYRSQARAMAQSSFQRDVDFAFLQRTYGLQPLMEGLFDDGTEAADEAAEEAGDDAPEEG